MERKLYALTTPDFWLPWAVDRQGDVLRGEAGHLPIVFWPDGAVCWEVNLFLLRGLRQHRSRRNRGGTLREYAKRLSPLLRFCQQNRVDFVDLTDARFALFVRTLLGERQARGKAREKRDISRVLAIGRTALQFLEFVQALYPGVTLIGPGGSIRAERKTLERVTPGGRVRVSYLHHYALPEPNPLRERLPIASATITQLHAANRTVSRSTFIKQRRFVMLHLFEITGARRIEVANIMVPDVAEARRTGTLPLFTAKRGQRRPTRRLPVSEGDLEILDEFIQRYRRRIIRKTIGLAADHGFLLVAETTGRPLTPDTLSNEVAALRKAAGITEEACAHGFRHRFITRLIVQLFRAHGAAAPGPADPAALSPEVVETIRRQAMEWTGHKSPQSLERYLHLAHAEVTNYARSLDLVKTVREYESAAAWLDNLRDELAILGPTAAIEQADRLLLRLAEKLRGLERMGQAPA